MSSYYLKYIYLTCFLILLKSVAFCQTDREFWFPAPEVDIANYPANGPYDRPVYLRLTSFTTNANVTISIPANPAFIPINIAIAVNSTSSVDLTAWINLIENSQANTIGNKGIYIQSSADITVYYEVNSITCKCNPELFAFKGKNAIGNEFYIPSQLTWSIDTIRFPDARAGFDIVATEDNTNITITPAKPLIGRPANIPFTITLNKGQTFSNQGLYRNGANLLNGSRVSATKPVAVTTKEDLLFSDGPCADLAGDQLVPINILGTEYGIVRGNLALRDKVAITAAQNNTSVFLDGSAIPSAIINAGQSYEVDLTTQPSLYVKSNNPVYVLHYTGNGCEVSAAVIPKLNCTGSSNLSIVRSSIGNAVVLIVTKNGNQNNFLVNGVPGIINAVDFSPLTGTGGAYVYCKKDLSGSMILNSATTFSNPAGKFQLGFINGDPGGYMYGYFSDFKKSNVSSTQAELCKRDSVQLNAFGGVTYLWSPATGLSNPNIGNPKASPATSTNYKVVITDQDACVDSAFVNTIITALDLDFTYKADVCNPLSVQFTGLGTDTQNPYWSFGDASTLTGNINPVHVYAAPGDYIIKYSVIRGPCTDTITKTINLSVIKEDIILTKDTTICFGTTKQLRTSTSLGFCWSPSTYLDNPNSANPITSAPQNITYFYTAEIPGTNIITNGNFSNGNTGFTSAYSHATPNLTEGQYFVGTSPSAWNPNLSNCGDHTTGTGNMMLVNGAPAPDVKVWNQTVTVTPNTNYAFSIWIQALWPPNPAQLQFSINNNDIGTLITASLPTCTWTQFYTTWNSGNNTTATISIVNKNTQVIGNDFALDDISFSPVLIKRDSVIITVEKPIITATNSTSICEGTSKQLNANGAATYEWSPPGSLDNPVSPSPLATPTGNTRYIVAGTTANGCVAKDTVDIAINPKPVITKSADAEICINNSTRLSASGGVSYSWSPAGTLDNASSPTPLATPVIPTTYIVTVTGANTCKNTDSIKIGVRDPDLFTINPPVDVCRKDSVQLNVTGGDTYAWQPANSMNDPASPTPLASPNNNTTYSVLITDVVCGFSKTLSTNVTVLRLPNVHATKSNDIDCSSNQSQLIATGALDFSWSPAATLYKPNTSTPIARPTTTTKYVVSGTAASGCTNYDSVIVNVSLTDNANYLMASAFTPNNDGKNDCYGIKYWGIIQAIDFSIYNRWGERVFHINTIGDCWDGNYKGRKEGTNVFVYIIRAKTTCQPEVFRKGTFTLIR